MDIETYYYQIDEYGRKTAIQIQSKKISKTIPVSHREYREVLDKVKAGRAEILLPEYEYVITPRGHDNYVHVQVKEGKGYVACLFNVDGNEEYRRVIELIQSEHVFVAVEVLDRRKIKEFVIRVFLKDVFQIKNNYQEIKTELIGFDQNWIVEVLTGDKVIKEPFVFEFLNNTRGVNTEVRIKLRDIGSLKKAYKFVKSFMNSNEKDIFLDSEAKNLTKHRRSKKSGVSSDWYYQWDVVLNYIPEFTTEILNRFIDLYRFTSWDRSVRRVGTSLINRSTLFEVYFEGESKPWQFPMSTDRRDQAITPFNVEMLENRQRYNYQNEKWGFYVHRIKEHLESHYYYEASVLGVSFMESILNYIFDNPGLTKYSTKLNLDCPNGFSARWKVLNKTLMEIDNYSSKIVKECFESIKVLYDNYRNNIAHSLLDGEHSLYFTQKESKEVRRLLSFLVDESKFDANFQSLVYHDKEFYPAIIRNLK